MNQSKYREDDIVYQLSVEDIQTVAKEELGRALTNTEVQKVIDKIGTFVPWYDAINSAIEEIVKK